MQDPVKIYLGIEPEELAEGVTEEQLVELIRCGVRFDHYQNAFVMFV